MLSVPWFSAKAKPNAGKSPVKEKSHHVVSAQKDRVSKKKTTISTFEMFKKLKALKQAQNESDAVNEAHEKKAKELEEHPLSKKLSGLNPPAFVLHYCCA